MVGVPLVVAVDLRPPSAASASATPGYWTRQAVVAREIDAAILNHQSVHLLTRVFGEQVLKQVEQMTPDVTVQQLVTYVFMTRFAKRALDCGADILRGIKQRTVDVEQVNRKGRNHAQAG